MDITPPKKTPPVAVPPPTPPPAPPSEPKKKRFSGEHTSLKSVLSTALLLITALSLALLLNTFVIQSYQVDGESMENTLQNNNRLIVNKIPRTISRITGHQYVPNRGDIIIFNQAGLPGYIGEKQLIKRVIALPGEHVVVSDGQITVYNKDHPEGFKPDDSGNYHTASPVSVGSFNDTLQKDEIFVCGDNRPNSEDSRIFGPVKTNEIVAKLVLRILPLNEVQAF